MKLSILIPARNEPYLQKTIDDIFEHSEADTEVIVGLDGYKPDSLEGTDPESFESDWGNGFYLFLVRKDGRRVRIHYNKIQIGQREMTNRLARSSGAEYVMKVDAHCSFGPGFDRIMLEAIDDRTILAPQMGVLDPVTWTVNGKKMRSRYCFGRDFIMQYDEDTDDDTMCLQGSAWMISRENYFKWNVCDETLGSWGGQAVELGIAAYLNGGRCRSTKETYYGHVFRHTNEEFPYERGNEPGKFATDELKRRYENKIEGLVKRFNYPLDWKV